MLHCLVSICAFSPGRWAVGAAHELVDGRHSLLIASKCQKLLCSIMCLLLCPC